MGKDKKKGKGKKGEAVGTASEETIADVRDQHYVDEALTDINNENLAMAYEALANQPVTMMGLVKFGTKGVEITDEEVKEKIGEVIGITGYVTKLEQLLINKLTKLKGEFENKLQAIEYNRDDKINRKELNTLLSETEAHWLAELHNDSDIKHYFAKSKGDVDTVFTPGRMEKLVKSIKNAGRWGVKTGVDIITLPLRPLGVGGKK